jgi:hypothetical protein
VQRLKMMSSTVERKAAVAPTDILRRMVYTADIKLTGIYSKQSLQLTIENLSTHCPETNLIPAALSAKTVSPLRGGRCILSAIEVVFASRRMVYLTGKSRVFILF